MYDRFIHFSKCDETSLFDGADAATLATVDVESSIARFEEILAARILVDYPDAEVSADDDRSNGYWADGYGTLQENIDVAANVQQIAEELFDDGNEWMVEAIRA